MGLANQFELAVSAIEFDALGKALDKLFTAIDFLAKRRRPSGGADFIDSVRVLGHLNAVRAQCQCSLAQDHIALIDAYFFDVIEGDGVSFKVDRFAAVGLFSMDGQGQQNRAQPGTKS